MLSDNEFSERTVWLKMDKPKVFWLDPSEFRSSQLEF